MHGRWNVTGGPLILVRDVRHPGLDLSPCVLDARSLRIGRLSSAELGQASIPELVLRHSSISKEHATIEQTHAGFVLRDAESTNGTFANEFRLGEYPIKVGDHLRFGDLWFVVLDANAFPYTAATPVSRPTEVPAGEKPWLSAHYRGSIPDVASCVFGAVILLEYDQVLAELSSLGIRRLETWLGRIVGQRIDADTYAFKERAGADLRVVLASRDTARVEVITEAIARDLEAAISDISMPSRTIMWSTSSVAPEVAVRKAVSRSTARASAGSSVAVCDGDDELRWVHVSDLHFGAGTVSWRHDCEQVLASLVRDLSRDRFAAHRVLVTGDVAFSGAAEQYELALGALERIAAAVGRSLAAVRVVPGNHDIDRRVAGAPSPTALHRYARTTTTALDDMLSDARARSILLEKLACFQAFVGKLPGHPTELDWRERLAIGSSPVDVWGLSSVWCSDSMDGRDEKGAFSANLVVGKAQYRELARQTLPAAVNLVMTHHPLEWIASVQGAWLRSAFASAPSVHLCGHVHRHASTAVVQLGRQNNRFTMVAGASHAEQNEPAAHSYSRSVLRREGARGWIVGWSPRVYDPSRDEFRVDRGEHDLDAEGYAWFSFPDRAV